MQEQKEGKDTDDHKAAVEGFVKQQAMQQGGFGEGGGVMEVEAEVEVQ